jgi:hypothetical protein
VAGAEVIGAAVCITLLIVVAYAVVGSVLKTEDVISNAQDDMSLMHEQQLGTSISVGETHWHSCRSGHCEGGVGGVGGTWVCTDTGNVFHFWVLNTGDQTISDLSHIDVMLIRGAGSPYLYSNGSGTDGMTYSSVGIYRNIGTNNVSNPATIPEDFNIGRWDPGEYFMGRIEVINPPDFFSVVLPNGVETAAGNIQRADVTC